MTFAMMIKVLHLAHADELRARYVFIVAVRFARALNKLGFFCFRYQLLDRATCANLFRLGSRLQRKAFKAYLARR